MLRARTLVVLALVAATVVALPAAPPAHATTPVHPHLLFDAADVPGLVARTASGEPAKAYASLIKKADAFLKPTYIDPATDGGFWQKDGNQQNQNKMGTVLADLAFAYKLSGNTAYADKALEWLTALAGAEWAHWNDNELGAGDLAKGVALAFDWLYDYMTPAQISTIVSSLVQEFPVVGDGHYYDLPAGTPAGTRTDRYKLFGCLDTDWAAASAPSNNWFGVCGGGLGLLALAIKDEAGVPTTTVNAMLRTAYGRVSNWISNNFGNGNADRTSTGADPAHGGDYQEGTGYLGYGGHNGFQFGFAWTHMGMTAASVGGTGAMADPLNEDGSEGLDEAPVYLAMEQLPGGGFQWPDRNDSELRPWHMVEVLPLFFKIRPDGLTGWLWDHTVGPDGDDYYGKVPPVYADDKEWENKAGPSASEVNVILYYKNPTELPRVDPASVANVGTARHYTEFGLVDMRTGFTGGADEVLSTFEAKRNYRGGHAQYDVGSFTLYGYGGNFATDSGYGQLAGVAAGSCKPAAKLQTGCGEEPDPAKYSAGRAIGHNVMLVLPEDPTNPDQGTHTQDYFNLRPSWATIPTFVAGTGLDYLRANLLSAYGNPPAVRASRNLVFTKAEGEPVFLAVADGLQRNTATDRRYEWRLNTDTSNAVAVAGQRFTITAPNGALLTGVATALDPRVMLVQKTQSGGLGTGPANSLALRSADAMGTAHPSIDHLAVMAVTPAGVTPPNVGVISPTNGNLVKATWTGGTTWFSSRGPAVTTVAGTGYSSDGAFAKVTEGRGDTVLDGGTFVKAGTATASHDYIRITGTGAAATVVVSGDTITVTGSTLGNTYAVWTPTTQGISHVFIDGVEKTSGISHTGNTWSFTH